MVKYEVDAVAHAIASAPRRAIVDRLAQGPASMTQLAEVLGVTLPAVDKHLRVLLDAGMVTKRKDDGQPSSPSTPAASTSSPPGR